MDPHGTQRTPDALDLMRRLAAGEASEDPQVRRALAEVEDALAAAQGVSGPPSPHVREAALAAFEAMKPVPAPRAPAAPVPAAVEGGRRRPAVRTEPLRGARLERSRWFPLQVAALLLVAVGAALWLASYGAPDAAAQVRLGAVHRVDLAGGRTEVSSGRWLAADERVAARAHEVVGLTLLDGTTVALDGAGALVVDEAGALHLEAGRACVAAGPRGATLAAAGGARLVVERGSGWMRASPPAVALAAGARGRAVAPDGRTTALVGPARLSLDDAAPEPAGDLFHALALFRPTRSPAQLGRLVDAARWRAEGGGVRRAGHSLEIAPRGASRTRRVAWRPSAAVRDARWIDVVLRAPAGTRVRLPAFDAGGAVAAPGRCSLVLTLPRDWYARLEADGREIEIEIGWPEGHDEAVRFEGMTFLFDPASPEV